MKLKSIIFDMDGLLVDTEVFWQKAEIQVFANLGVGLTVKDCERVMGLRCDEAVATFLQMYSLPFEPGPLVSEIESSVIDMVAKEPRILPGVGKSIELFQKLGFSLAVCSSSSLRVIEGVLRASGLSKSLKTLVSAEHESYGKPHPAVYLTALKRLGISHNEALVFEDSIFGIIAAKAARIPVVGVPNVLPRSDPRFGVADSVIDSMEEVTEKWLESFLK